MKAYKLKDILEYSTSKDAYHDPGFYIDPEEIKARNTCDVIPLKDLFTRVDKELQNKLSSKGFEIDSYVDADLMTETNSKVKARDIDGWFYGCHYDAYLLKKFSKKCIKLSDIAEFLLK